MKKNIIIIVVICVFFLLIMSLSWFKSDKAEIKQALLTYGFSEVEKNSYYTYVLDGSYDDYIYDGSKYKVLNFNMENFTLSESFMENVDDVDFTYSANFEYGYDTVDYSARYTYKQSNIIINGNYNINDKSFSCNPEISYGADLTQVKNDLCDELKIYVSDFYSISSSIFDENEINIIKNNRE